MTPEEDLKHFYYHWLWGLRHYSTPQSLSLWSQISHWSANEIILSRKKQTEIKRKIWPIRIFYWLFNLSDYAGNYYQLAAHDLIAEHKNNGITMSFFDKVKRNGKTFLGNLQNNFRSNEPEEGTQGHQEQSKHNKKEELSRPPEVINEELQVATWMRPHFKTLGMEVESGQLIKFNEIKKTYRQKALVLHPDKNPSSMAHQDFVKLSTAYKQLEMAFSGLSEEVISRFSNADLWEMCGELRSRIDKVIQSIDTVIQSYDEISKRAQEMSQNTQAMIDRMDILFKKCDAEQLYIEETNRRLDELERVMAEKASQVSDELPEKDNNEPASHASQVRLTTGPQEQNAFTAERLLGAQNLEPLTSLVRSGFANTLIINGVAENYFSQLRRVSFPLT